MNLKLITTFLMLALFSSVGQSQSLSACGSPTPVGATTCQASCVYCDLNGLTGTLPTPTGTVQNINCSGTVALENPRWYGFVAGSTSLTLSIVPSACSGFNGLQAVVVKECGNTAIACAKGTAGGAGITLTLPLTNLTVGNAYQLAVDGFNGDVCSYQINVTTGSVVPPALGSIGPIQGLDQVCPNARVTYTIPAVANATTYTWTAPYGAKIDGGDNIRTYASPAGRTVSIEFGKSSGQVCVTASNICNPPVTVCKTITNTPLATTVLPDLYICYEDLAFNWSEEPYYLLNTPGVYDLISEPYPSYLGCDSIVQQKVVILQYRYTDLGNIYLCKDECTTVGESEFCTPGIYAETIESADGCDSTIFFSITNIEVVAAAQNTDTITCGQPSVTLTSVGSSTGSDVQYEWFNSSLVTVSTHAEAVVTEPGTYTLVVTKTNGGHSCSASTTVEVPVAIEYPIAKAGPKKTITCAVPEVQLEGTGSVGPEFTYLWSPSLFGNIVAGAATLTPTVNATGTYTLRVTNNLNGCTASSGTIVYVDQNPPLVNTTDGLVNCDFQTDTIFLTTSAANASFVWSGPNNFSSTEQSPIVSEGGTYYVTVTNETSGCTNIGAAFIINDKDEPGAYATANSITCINPVAALTANSPAANAQYIWTGPNNFYAGVQNPVTNTPGNYTLKVIGTNGCFSTAMVQVKLDTVSPIVSVAPTSSINCFANSVNIIATPANNNATLTFSWRLPDGSTVSTGSTPVLATNKVGDYQLVTIDMANGCTSSTSTSVIQRQPVTIEVVNLQNANCFNDQNGSIEVNGQGGDGQFHWNWNNGDTTNTVSNLVSGEYFVTLTDGENCSKTTSFVVAQPDPLQPNVSAIPQMINGQADGSVLAAPTGGNAPYTYAWDNGETTANISGLMPGFFTVTITDGKGCSAVESATVNAVNCAIGTDISIENISCFGASDGRAAVKITGATYPVNYEWSDGSTADFFNNVGPGNYSVTITDAANCPALLSFSIIEPNVLSVNAAASNSFGQNTANGTAIATPTGGTGNYVYTWSNGDSTGLITLLSPNDYTVTVADENGCTDIQTVTVGVDNCGAIPDFIFTYPSCYGNSDGKILSVLTGGTAPFTYEWNNGRTESNLVDIPAGTYSLTVTDADNCNFVLHPTLSQPDSLSVQPVFVGTTICGSDPTAIVIVTSQGGTGIVEFLWSNGQMGDTATSLKATTYIVTATDINGCTATTSATVLASDNILPSVVLVPSTVSLGNSGTVTLTAQNMQVEATDNCNIAEIIFLPPSFNCTEQGNHEVLVTVIDDAGNSVSGTTTVTVVDDAAPTLVCSQSIIRCFGDDFVNYTLPVADDNCPIVGGGFAFVTGLPSGSQFPAGVTTNTFTYTDVNGNVGSCTFEVTILDKVVTTIGQVKNDIGNASVGSIQVSVSGGLSPYTFQWKKDGINFASTQNLTNIGAGSYTLEVTDAFGCTAISTSIAVTNTVGTNEPTWSAGISIQPNPAADYVDIVFVKTMTDELHVSLVDATGKKIQEFSLLPQNRISLDLSNVPAGLYSLSVRTGKESVARKITVIR